MKHELDPETRTVRLIFPGDVLSTNVETMRTEAFAAIQEEAGAAAQWDVAEMDLNTAQMVDSVGLNLLVSLYKALRSQGKKMRIRIGSAHVRRAMHLTRMDQIAEVVG